MNDIAEVMKLGLLLERKLSERGLVDQNGDLTSPFLPTDIEEKLDGLIENPIELEGILRLANAARRGEALSAPVANATRLMIEEICNALFEPDEFQKITRIH
ncbi:hypothetical protein [Neorhizobium sp. S3-V5DH]|uniref:hypothetical protein n=1 Tax=Neorhizobium sp. S3-V5DH TaxID=2485166 RepID=UPI00104305BF|nr:hypothetical protein [Neorhizobium sp. S3-V5DH]TCV58361.1 hypothetical protein EDE09_13820 [Neorhizobium sp. S3-V5DH]